MKHLNDYLVESKQTFDYRVKIAGDFSKDHWDSFTKALEQFDVESISKLTTTPITKDPFGFPGLENVEVHIADIKLNYPASFQQILDLARVAGCDISRMRVLSNGWDESMTTELDATVGDDSTRLEDPDYPAPSAEQKKASKEYSNSFKDIVNNANESEFEIAGDAAPAAKFNTDAKQDVKSPMTKVANKRPTAKSMTR